MNNSNERGSGATWLDAEERPMMTEVEVVEVGKKLDAIFLRIDQVLERMSEPTLDRVRNSKEEPAPPPPV